MLGFFLTATWEDMKIRVGKGVGIDRRLCFLVWKVALEMIVSLLVTGDVHCRPETHIWNTNYVYDGIRVMDWWRHVSYEVEGDDIGSHL